MNDSISLTKLSLIYIFYFTSSFVYLLSLIFIPKITLSDSKKNCKIIPLGVSLGILMNQFGKDYLLGLIGFMLMSIGCLLFHKIKRFSCLEKKHKKKNHRKI